ncbi:MAG TPA: hypothetical protein VIF32_09770 [Gemmatimonadaceae bacterium]
MMIDSRLSALGSRLAVAVSLAALISCATRKPGADSTAMLATDTVKPAPPSVTVQAPDTTKTAPTSTKTKTKATKTKTGTSAKTSAKQKADSHLGRDSVIKFDPSDPRRQLPTIPPKKPPQ